jgi:hypothetical protein
LFFLSQSLGNPDRIGCMDAKEDPEDLFFLVPSLDFVQTLMLLLFTEASIQVVRSLHNSAAMIYL